VQSTLTKTGSVMGTPAYMSPQQATGHAVESRTDLFSLGIVLYEMVAGQKPFRGESLPELMFKIIKEEPEMGPIPDGPEWQRLRGVIMRALQKKPEDRYPDAGAMRADLELALKELGGSANWTPPPSREPVGPSTRG
jgi:serine/threonine-protein kinase